MCHSPWNIIEYVLRVPKRVFLHGVIVIVLLVFFAICFTASAILYGFFCSCEISLIEKKVQTIKEFAKLCAFPALLAISAFTPYAPSNLTHLDLDAPCTPSLREKCPNTELFLVHISCIRTEYGDSFRKSPYSARIQENTDQK